ncbi:MAG: hypothetical protein IPF53_06155 [Blastocatellia bacterium]|nr:hypothetical protein [Blastocatellia bacterium]
MTTAPADRPPVAVDAEPASVKAVAVQPASHRPSLHILLVALLSLVAVAAHAGVISAGALRGSTRASWWQFGM